MGGACSKCKRRFSHPRQWHSCVTVSVAEHFKGKPELKRLYNRLVRELRKSGPVRADAVKTAINLGAKAHFGMVYVMKDSLRLNFTLPRRVKSRRLKAGGKMGSYYPYTVTLREEADVNKQLLGWLREAYHTKR